MSTQDEFVVRRRHQDALKVRLSVYSGNDRQADALVEFVDPVSDLAVLSNNGYGGTVSNTRDERFRQDFDKLLDGLVSQPLRAELTPFCGRFRVHVYTFLGKWLSGQADLPLCTARELSIEFDEPIPEGTSGSPLFTDAGEVVGMLSESGDTTAFAAHLAMVMPMWLRCAASSSSPQ